MSYFSPVRSSHVRAEANIAEDMVVRPYLAEFVIGLQHARNTKLHIGCCNQCPPTCSGKQFPLRERHGFIRRDL